jgi:hypothetical protein
MGRIMSDRDRESAAEPTGAPPSLGSVSAVPQLSAAQFARMAAYEMARPVQVGDVVFGPGDVDYDLILVESGWIEILSPAIGDESSRWSPALELRWHWGVHNRWPATVGGWGW